MKLWSGVVLLCAFAIVSPAQVGEVSLNFGWAVMKDNVLGLGADLQGTRFTIDDGFNLAARFTQDLAVFETDDPLTEGKYFPLRMGNVKNRNISSSVPGAQIFDDLGLCWIVKGGEWLIKHQHAGIGDKRTCQRYALALAAGNFIWLVIAKS